MERIITITINENTKAVSYRINGEEVKDLIAFTVEYKAGETLQISRAVMDKEDEK